MGSETRAGMGFLKLKTLINLETCLIIVSLILPECLIWVRYQFKSPGK